MSERIAVAGVDPEGRYRVLRKLRQGGSRRSYEAEDRERGELVLLETFETDNPVSRERLRAEFDKLQRIEHPNLLKLHEIHVTGLRGFFTTELVQGADFVGYSALQTPARGSIACDETKLRATLRQLASALHALHGAGRMHRDTAPSSVRVTDAGRLVLLHTPLLHEDLEDETDTNPDAVAEALAYMSPEQTESFSKLGPASDWYRFGSLLYRALSGQPPFSGNAMDQLIKKRAQDPVSVGSLAHGVPEDLERLCMALLAREPAQRPSGEQVLAELGVASAESISLRKLSSAIARLAFVGRDAELARLSLAYDAMRAGCSVALLVVGPEGVGKTALADEFAARLAREHPETLVVELRCSAPEPQPARAVEPLLEHLRRGERPAVPRIDEHALLSRLTSWESSDDEQEQGLSGDLEAIRSRTLHAERHALGQLAEGRRVVVIVDDAEQLDGDSLTVLAELLRTPDPPPVLLVLCGTPAMDARVLRLVSDETTLFQIELSPLGADQARTLLQTIVRPGQPADTELLTRLAQGSPLLLEQLGRYARRQPDAQPPGSLAGILDARLQALSPAGRRLLELLATAGEPLPAKRIGEASGLEAGELEAELHHLLRDGFIRDREVPGSIAFEVLHPAVLRHVLARCTERLAELHRALLTNNLDPERTARHALLAGDVARAVEALTVSARRALAAGSFARAAVYLELVLERGTPDESAARALRAALGEALALSARAEASAEAFVHASRGAAPGMSLALRQRAAEQLLLSGQLQGGLNALRTLLEEVGVGLARAPWLALLGLLIRRLWLAVRGYGYRPRAERELPERELLRLDVLRFAAATLVTVDAVRATHLATQHVLYALKLGEPARVAHAFAMQAISFAMEGATARAELLLTKTRAISVGARQPWLLAAAAAAEMTIYFVAQNTWRKAFSKFAELEGFLLASPRPARWDIDSARTLGCLSLRYLAECDQLHREMNRYVAECERRGDVHGALQLQLQCNIVWLARDEPRRAERELEQALGKWVPASKRNYHTQHFSGCLARCELELYRGRPSAARAALDHDLPALKASLMLRVPVLRVVTAFLDGRIALAEAAAAPGAQQRSAHVRHALAVARRLARVSLPLAPGCVTLLRSGAAELSGQRKRSQLLLREAVTELERSETLLFSFAARYRLGKSLGGRDGSELVEQTLRWAAQHGIKNPARLVTMLAPGWSDET